MKLLLSFFLMASLLTLSSCGGGGGGSAGGSSSVAKTEFSAKLVNVDNNTYLSFLSNPKSNFSLFDLIIPKALAALFVDMEPYFAPYYETFGVPESRGQSLDANYKGFFCTDAVLANFSGATQTQKQNCLKDNLTVYPLIAHTSYTGGSSDDTVSIANLVEDKYYHFSVARLGGGVYTGQNVTVELVYFDGTSYVPALDSDCGLSIVNSVATQNRGDIIVQTHDVNANDGGNYYSSFLSAINSSCYFNVYGTFAGITLPQSEGKKIKIGKILDEDTAGYSYPSISSVSFNGSLVTSSEISISYSSLTNKRSDGYTYADWQVTQNVGGAVSAISQTYWAFTCGGGGSEGRWMNTVTDNDRLNNHLTRKYMEDYQNDTIVDPKLFHWRVGFCNEMLMMVSAKDTNNNLVQKKIAIITK